MNFIDMTWLLSKSACTIYKTCEECAFFTGRIGCPRDDQCALNLVRKGYCKNELKEELQKHIDSEKRNVETLEMMFRE